MPAERPDSASSPGTSVAATAAANAAPGRPAAATPPSSPSKPAERASQSTSALDEGGAKETVESILVAFILAFIFRAFIVEAFVIPTGSMAPTLLGAHMRFRCEDCGYPFDVNYTGRTVGDDVEIPSVARGKVFAAVCPNCGLKVARENSNDPQNDATSPLVHYGDRILVLKYAYLLNGPRRWDVVVFKTPDRASPEVRQTVAPYTINYIKRLVGRPGESVFILDGDIYVGRHGDPVTRHVVQTKPRIAQAALWRVVFDNDYQPTRAGWERPWEEDSPGDGGWVTAELAANGRTVPARVLTFDNAAGAGWLRFNSEAAPEKQALTDWLAYAATKRQTGMESYDSGGLVARNVVTDLKLQLFYERAAGTGPLRLEMTKFDDVFTAELTPGKARLLRRDVREPPEANQELAAAALEANPAGPLRVEFTNVDYRVAVRIDGRELLRTTPDQYRPNIDRLLAAYRREDAAHKPEVRIGAEGQTCALSHVSLWRDVYYTNRDHESYGRIKWGTPERPMRLEAGQFWVLGDNSLMSGDGRYWDQPVDLPDESLEAQPGVVPARFMLGKAFFVYWPAGHRPYPGLPGLVPNFGDMRFIH